MRRDTIQNDAVSPVIAVILLIGLTVILAGAVGLSVMSFANTSSYSDYRVVGAMMDEYSYISGGAETRGVVVLLEASSSAAAISEMRVAVHGTVLYADAGTGAEGVANPQFGTPYIFTVSPKDNDKLNGEKASVVVKFAGGSEYVVLSQVLNFGGAEDDGIDAIPGIAIKLNDYDINVDNIPGHGISLRISDAALAENISSIRVTAECAAAKLVDLMVDGVGEKNTFVKKDQKYRFYIPLGKTESGAEMIPYSRVPQDLEQVWDITVYATPKAGKTITGIDGRPSSAETIILKTTKRIDAREGVLPNGDAVSASVNMTAVNNSCVTVEITFPGCLSTNGIDKITTVNNVAYVVKSADGTVVDEKGYNNQKITANNLWTANVKWGGSLNLDKYADTDIFQVYLGIYRINSGNGKTIGWYLVGEKTVGKLKADYAPTS